MSSDGGETDAGGSRHDRFSIEKRDSGPTMVAPRERAKREVENGFAQFDLLLEMIDDGLKARESKSFRLRASMLNKLNRAAVDGLVERPGSYRVGEMEIRNSGHRPPPPAEVDEYTDKMCEWVNDNFGRSGLELAAYLMWRVNWIHPYSDGNGRTARAASYLITCVRAGTRLPGRVAMPTLVEQEMEEAAREGSKSEYYAALEAADRADLEGNLDVSKMMDYLGSLLHHQVRDSWNSSVSMARDSAEVMGASGVGGLTQIQETTHRRGPPARLTMGQRWLVGILVMVIIGVATIVATCVA
jgi:fido (protein-threonine AMPylation protein)